MKDEGVMELPELLFLNRTSSSTSTSMVVKHEFRDDSHGGVVHLFQRNRETVTELDPKWFMRGYHKGGQQLGSIQFRCFSFKLAKDLFDFGRDFFFTFMKRQMLLVIALNKLFQFAEHGGVV